jgi:hypothetical protein
LDVPPSEVYRFRDFTLDPVTRELIVDWSGPMWLVVLR